MPIRFPKLRLSFAVALLATVFSLPSLSEPTRIMCLGDSRTAGPTSRDCYRLYLDKLLTQVGYSYDLVGSMKKHLEDRVPADSVFDVDHEGHWGWTVEKSIWDGFSNQGVETWARADSPQIVLAMLGTTDMLLESDSLHLRINRTVSEIGQVIDKLRSVNPSVAILLSNLYPVNQYSFAQAPAVDSMSLYIPGIAAAMSTDSSPVIFVDICKTFDRQRDLVDPIHANRNGCTKMAYAWLDALWPFFDSIPPVVSTRVPVGRLRLADGPDGRAIFSVMGQVSGESGLFTPAGRMIPAWTGHLPANASARVIVVPAKGRKE